LGFFNSYAIAAQIKRNITCLSIAASSSG